MAYKREISAILLSLASLFIFFASHFPGKTGVVGYGLYHILITLFGIKGTLFFPFFLLLPALSLMVTTTQIQKTTLASLISYLLTVILIQMNYNPITTYAWPPDNHNGGIIGTYGATLLLTAFGSYGAIIVIIALLLISFILSFQWSLFTTLKQTKSTLTLFFSTRNWSQFPKLKPILVTLFFIKRSNLQPLLRSEKKQPKKKTKSTPSTTDTNETFSIPDIIKPEPPKKKTISKKEDIPATPLPTLETTSGFQLPSIDLLKKGSLSDKSDTKDDNHHREQAQILEMALESFNVDAKVVHITTGPSVTRYELKPGEGVKISKITSLSKDIALKLATPDVRIEAPIPGKALIGIEVPNLSVDMVTLRSIMENTDFYDKESKLMVGLGLTITGESILMDLSKMPHILIAGATGAGKSVCINTIIISILMRATPDDVKFLMIDPKKVELSLYEDIPHLVAPVVTNPHMAAATLKKWALTEMENRYELFSKVGVKDIKGYNDYVSQQTSDSNTPNENEETITEENTTPSVKKLPYIVVLIDELADLMMVASQDVEQTICRLAQMARATGIHLVIATQRPSVNVVTGLIKANVPSRISFFLQSQIDSRTILDMAGAEKLLGKGDMLYSPVGSFKPKRIQGVFVSESEVKNIVSWLKTQEKPAYNPELLEIEPLEAGSEASESEGEDALFEEAKNLVQNTKYASTSYLQRKLRIGYNRAARLMDDLEAKGIIASYAGEKKSRDVI